VPSYDVANNVCRALTLGHNLPTVSIEQAGEMEYKELVEKGIRDAQRKIANDREEGLKSAEQVEDEAVHKARAWDDWKDDHPWGEGNSKLRPCS